MFTGLIEAVGTVSSVRPVPGGVELGVSWPADSISDSGPGVSGRSAFLGIGDSVSINGACQTVTTVNGLEFTVQAVGETLEKTTLGSLRPTEPVNLERSLPADGRLDGHIVMGHVNAVGRVTRCDRRGDGAYLEVEFPGSLEAYIVSEGSIAIDGISLTVASCSARRIGINVVPHTLSHTNLGRRRPGHQVNLEVDILAKYIEKLLRHGGSGLSRGLGAQGARDESYY